jgi:5'-deoxynucleotidase YfbR-like HD superfamily hydrolase
MKSLPNLIKIMELMRAQTQYGYLLSGIPRQQLSGLTEHHYLVSFIGWQIAVNLKNAGANIDVLKVVEFCLIHDIGELMGGDISAPYAAINPKAREYAKAFEEENQKFVINLFGQDSERVKAMAKEILNAQSDEALIAKVADYIECTNFKVYIGHYKPSDKEFNQKKITEFIDRMKDKVAKELISKFFSDWLESIEDTDYFAMLKSNG